MLKTQQILNELFSPFTFEIQSKSLQVFLNGNNFAFYLKGLFIDLRESADTHASTGGRGR